MLVTCFSTARSVTTSSRRDRGVGASFRHQGEHLPLSTGKLIERSGRPAGEHSGHDLGVEHGPALGNAADRVDEPFEVGHPVLEQVADALRALGQKLGRVLLLDVLREHEHPVPGSSDRMIRAAFRPSSVWVGGILMSTIATSGLCARTLRSRSSRSPASPTTSKPSSWSRRATPARSRSESSASTTRTAKEPPVVRRDTTRGALSKGELPDPSVWERHRALASPRTHTVRLTARPRVSNPNAKTPARRTDRHLSGWDRGAVLKTHRNGGDAMQHPPRNPARHLAARMGHWSASHRKLAIFGWLAFVVAAIVIGTAVGTKTIDQSNNNTVGPSAAGGPDPQARRVQAVRASDRDRGRPEQAPDDRQP